MTVRGSTCGLPTDYNIFRWYRAGWGRYTQVDPSGIRAFVNLYAYVDARPTVLIDPLGLMSVDPTTCGKYACDCALKVNKAAKDFDKFWQPGWASKKPKCFKALSNLGIKFQAPSGATPITCMIKQAPKMTIKCASGGSNCGGPPNIGSYDPNVVWVQPTFCGDICGTALNTIFHEALHNCGAPDETDQLGGLAKQIADVCVGE